MVWGKVLSPVTGPSLALPFSRRVIALEPDLSDGSRIPRG